MPLFTFICLELLLCFMAMISRLIDTVLYLAVTVRRCTYKCLLTAASVSASGVWHPELSNKELKKEKKRIWALYKLRSRGKVIQGRGKAPRFLNFMGTISTPTRTRCILTCIIYTYISDAKLDATTFKYVEKPRQCQNYHRYYIFI